MGEPAEAPRSWWAEWQLWLVLAVMAGVMLPRLDAIPFRGEEHRRVQVTAEMAAAGDWFVPREHGRIFFSRPPFQQWVIAASEWVFPNDDRWAARFPCALAALLACAMIYGYARQFVGRTGATVAALAYGTMGQILTESQQAETESIFALALSASLILWHWGYTRKWPTALTWGAAYGCAAIAGLCKGGLQPPVYLLGAIGLFLLWKRDVRFVFRWGHLAGLAFGAAVVAAWAVPCADRVGWDDTRKIWMTDTSSRFLDWKLDQFLAHFGAFPVEMFPCLLPWGLVALAAVLPGTRRAMAGCDAVAFCGLALVVAVPTCWLPPGGQSRYLVGVYPCLAVLVGVFADRVLTVAEVAAPWRRFVLAVGGMLLAAAGAVVAARWVLPGTGFERFILTPGQVALYAGVLCVLAVLLVKLRNTRTPGGIVAAAVAVALGSGVLVTGVYTDARAAHTNDIARGLGPVRERVPHDQPVIVIGEVSAAVRYHMHGVQLQPTPEAQPRVPPGSYFCVEEYGGQRRQLPFAWEPVAVVSLDRYVTATPFLEVIVGRRVPRKKT